VRPGYAALTAKKFVLGRGLISAQPKSDRSKLDEGKVIGGELVIAGGDAPVLLDLVEEPLDQVVRPVEMPRGLFGSIGLMTLRSQSLGS
jgi:hypothetical protein